MLLTHIRCAKRTDSKESYNTSKHTSTDLAALFLLTYQGIVLQKVIFQLFLIKHLWQASRVFMHAWRGLKHEFTALCVNTAVLSMLHKAWNSHTFLCQTSCNLVHISRLWQKCLLQTNQLILSDLRILFWEPRFWACLSFQSQILTVKTQKVLLNNSYCLGHPRYLLNISISKAALGFSSVLYWGRGHVCTPWTPTDTVAEHPRLSSFHVTRSLELRGASPGPQLSMELWVKWHVYNASIITDTCNLHEVDQVHQVKKLSIS